MASVIVESSQQNGGGSWWYFSRIRGLSGNIFKNEFPPAVSSHSHPHPSDGDRSRTPIPLFTSESVHSGAAMWTPYKLTDAQKSMRVQTGTYRLKLLEPNGPKRLTAMVIGDETWIYLYGLPANAGMLLT